MTNKQRNCFEWGKNDLRENVHWGIGDGELCWEIVQGVNYLI